MLKNLCAIDATRSVPLNSTPQAGSRHTCRSPSVALGTSLPIARTAAPRSSSVSRPRRGPDRRSCRQQVPSRQRARPVLNCCQCPREEIRENETQIPLHRSIEMPEVVQRQINCSQPGQLKNGADRIMAEGTEQFVLIVCQLCRRILKRTAHFSMTFQHFVRRRSHSARSIPIA